MNHHNQSPWREAKTNEPSQNQRSTDTKVQTSSQVLWSNQNRAWLSSFALIARLNCVHRGMKGSSRVVALFMMEPVWRHVYLNKQENPFR